MTRADIAAVLEPMLAPWPEAIQQLHLDACARLAEIMHPADLLVYDNYNAVAPGWSYTGRTSDVAICLPIGTTGIRLGFYRGINLDDPEKRLLGEGNMFRSLKMTSLDLLDDPYVQRRLRVGSVGGQHEPVACGAHPPAARGLTCVLRE